MLLCCCAVVLLCCYAIVLLCRLLSVQTILGYKGSIFGTLLVYVYPAAMLLALKTQCHTDGRGSALKALQWWEREDDSDAKLLSSLDDDDFSSHGDRRGSARRSSVTCCGTLARMACHGHCWSLEGVLLIAFVGVGVACGVLGVLSTAGVNI